MNVNPFAAAISVMLNVGPNLFFFSCSTRCYWCIPLRGNFYTPMCIWWVLLVMRIAKSTFHDESYSSPAVKGLNNRYVISVVLRVPNWTSRYFV